MEIKQSLVGLSKVLVVTIFVQNELKIAGITEDVHLMKRLNFNDGQIIRGVLREIFVCLRAICDTEGTMFV